MITVSINKMWRGNFLSLALIILLPFSSIAKDSNEKRVKQNVNALISSCKNYNGVEVLNLGWFATSIAKGVVKFASDNSANNNEKAAMQQALMVIKGLKGVSILYYEDAKEPVKEKINSLVNKVMGDIELLMEAKDDGEMVKLCGNVNERGDVKNLAIFIPSSYTFIFLKGSFRLNDITKAIEAKRDSKSI